MEAAALKRLTGDLSVLLVEDDAAVRAPVESMLGALFREVRSAADGQEGLECYRQMRPDLVISDISMPRMDGLAMARAIRKERVDQPLIFSTAHGDSDLLMRAIELNVEGYLIKPVAQGALFETLAKAARRIIDEQKLRFYHNHLEELVAQKSADLQSALEAKEQLNEEINETLEETILTLGGIAEARSQETGQHVYRVAHYSERLARLWGMDEQQADRLRIISPMHDVGKLSIPDTILHKPDKLTDGEFALMRTHTLIGYEMLKSSKRPIFRDAAIVALQHHERYDGQGYPHRLKAEAIHPYGRITALADVFDALLSERVYKPAWPLERVVDLIRSERGKHFDPELADLMLGNLEQFVAIRDRFSGD